MLGEGNDQNARAGSREGSGEVWRVDMKKGCGEGETGRGTVGKGRLGDGDKVRRRWRGGNGEGGEMGRGQRGGGKEVGMGRGRRRGKRRGDFTDGYDGMPGWT